MHDLQNVEHCQSSVELSAVKMEVIRKSSNPEENSLSFLNTSVSGIHTWRFQHWRDPAIIPSISHPCINT